MHKRTATAVVLFVGAAALACALAQAPKEDEQYIRKSTDSYAAAFNKGDLDGIMAYWAADADYVDDNGKTYRGKQAIAALFKEHLNHLKGYRMELHIKH